jgi:CheY-like chemotaxis protein
MNEQIQILVVEDDNDVREAVVESLAQAGYAVGWAAHGGEALRMLQQMKSLPAVVLLDLMMPVVDGWQFRERQVADPALARVPVLGMTARRDVTGLDVDGVLRKPIDLDSLLAAVEPFCRQVATSSAR